ncbi:hypothetical protein [Ensifer sp. B1-9]|uniref:P-type ATPase n=1 Tax=Ensifer sp. B1-9 TaxID=3141455 RepID=UPI003D1DBDF2
MVDRANVLFAGTSARSGSAKALVVNTGKETELAKIAVAIERQESETEFARGIRRFGYLMMQIMLAIFPSYPRSVSRPCLCLFYGVSLRSRVSI